MLRKKLFLTTFCLTLFWPGSFQAAKSWKKVALNQVVHSDQYWLSDGRQVKLIGVSGLNLESPQKNESCLTESARLRLQKLLIGEVISMKPSRVSPPRAHIWPVYLKRENQDLAEYLLREGLAVTNDEDHLYLKSYQAAQRLAQKEHKGRWGQCDQHLAGLKWKKARGRTEWFWGRYHTYLQPVSVGRVTAVLAGNLLQIENGLRVRLANLSLPNEDSGPAHACFANASRYHLESLVLGRTVELRADDQFMDGYKTVRRQVYLPSTRQQPEIWINRAMIADGFARFDGKDASLKYVQESVWKNPNGAWRDCLMDQIMTEEKAVKVEIELEYDIECPIKGNVSGSKQDPKRTYHTPASSWYKRLQPEACFEVEEDAIEAGFTKVK